MTLKCMKLISQLTTWCSLFRSHFLIESYVEMKMFLRSSFTETGIQSKDQVRSNSAFQELVQM